MNNSRIDLNLLVVFDAVARTGSVTRAAQMLSLSQPAVSHALNRLRKATGDPLFLRSGGRIAPTPFAEDLKQRTGDILAGARAALSGSRFDPATTTRTFRIGVSDYAALTLAPTVTSALRRAAPGATIEFAPVSRATLDDLESGALDVTFWGADAPPAPHEWQLVFEDRFVVLTGQTHPLALKAARGSPLVLGDYIAFPHARVAIAGATPSPVDVALAALGVNRRIAVTAPGFASLLALLDGSPLIATVPARLADAEPGRPFASFPAPFAIPPFAYLIVWHRRQNADAAHPWLRSTIKGAIGRPVQAA